MAEAPAAPLEKAVEESRRALVDADRQNVPIDSLWRCYRALRSLLAALDADKRLERAEAALRPFADPESYSTTEEQCRRNAQMDWCAIHSFRWPCPVDAACRYFAEKGER